MIKQYRIIGKSGNIPFNEPVESQFLSFLPMRFIEYVRDESGFICGAKFLADLGHGYGFNNGEKEFMMHPGDEFQFDHEYTDSTDGTWNNDSFRVEVRLIEE